MPGCIMPGMHEETPACRTALYRFYDAAGQLLYVGITGDAKARWRQHAKEKEWWPQVAHKRIAWFSSRDEAAVAERLAIVAEAPRFNIDMNTPQFRQWYQLGWLNQVLRAEEQVLCTPRKPRSKAGRAALADIHRRQELVARHHPFALADSLCIDEAPPWSGEELWSPVSPDVLARRTRDACDTCGQPYPCHTLREIFQPFADLPGYCF